MRGDEERRDRGLAAYASQLGIPLEDVEEHFVTRFGARFAEEAFAAMGGAWQPDALSLRDRSLAVVAALVTMGGSEERLRPHVRWAVEHGATREELEALITLLGVYVGLARASLGMDVVREELARLGI